MRNLTEWAGRLYNTDGPRIMCAPSPHHPQPKPCQDSLRIATKIATRGSKINSITHLIQGANLTASAEVLREANNSPAQ
jgi:hypothetical protein